MSEEQKQKNQAAIELLTKWQNRPPQDEDIWAAFEQVRKENPNIEFDELPEYQSRELLKECAKLSERYYLLLGAVRKMREAQVNYYSKWHSDELKREQLKRLSEDEREVDEMLKEME